jgi:hypothetical protein
LFNFRIAPFTTYSSAPDQTSLGIGKKNEIKKKTFQKKHGHLMGQRIENTDFDLIENGIYNASYF